MALSRNSNNAGLTGTEILELKKGLLEDTHLFDGISRSLEATDITAESLHQVGSSTAGLTMASPICSHMVDPNQLGENYFNKQFDLVIADFDELNCLSPDVLKNFFATLPGLMAPRGRFIGVFKTRFCIWNLIWRSCTFRFGKLITRLQAEEKVFEDTEWKYQPARISRLCRKAFVINTIRPVGLLLPPLELNAIFTNKHEWLMKLVCLEKKVNSIKPLAGYADYFLIDIQLK